MSVKVCAVLPNVFPKSFMNKIKPLSILVLLDGVFHYCQGLQRSCTVFIKQSLAPLCLYTGGANFVFILPVYGFGLDYVIIWQAHMCALAVISPRATAGEKKPLFAFSQQVVN